MTESSEYKLAQTLIWSNQEYKLKEFVDNFPLPQVVLVKDGYCGNDERTTFSSDQILTLHRLWVTPKLVCQVEYRKNILLPTFCSSLAELLPLDGHEMTLSVRHLLETHRHIKYVRALKVDANWSKSFKRNDVLEIKKIESNSAGIRCKNLSANHDSYISSHDSSTFVALLDPNLYTLAGIKAKHGFPAKIRFVDRNNNIGNLPPDSEQFTAKLTRLGQMTVIGEIEEKDVIVTVVCANVEEEKVCFKVPLKLDIQVTVANGFLEGNKTYASVVNTLDKQFKQTDLTAFKNLDVDKHIDAVQKTINNSAGVFMIEEASSETMELLRERMSQNSVTNEEPPDLPIRSPTSVKSPPPRPPKRPSVKTTKQESVFGKFFHGKKDSNDSAKSSQVGNAKNIKHQEQSNGRYTTILQKEDVYEEPLSDDSNDYEDYTDLDSDYTTKQCYFSLKPTDVRKSPASSIQDIPLPPLPVDQHPFMSPEGTIQGTPLPPLPVDQHPLVTPKSTIQDLPLPPLPVDEHPSVSHKPAIKDTPLPPLPANQYPSPPPLPSHIPPTEGSALYEALSKYPQDLSDLKISDVGRLLSYLGMKDYVETFKAEMIDGSLLITMDKESLESLNVTSFHCNKLMRFIGGWRPKI